MRISYFYISLLIMLVANISFAVTVTPTNGMVITTNTTFTPGTYNLPNGISIGANNITLDGNGAILVGTNYQNYGVSVSNKNGVTIKNLTVKRYKYDFYCYNADNITVMNCNAWETYELPEGSIFLNIFDGPNGSYDHAMWFRYCDNGQILNNDASNQQNGISLFNCTYMLVEGNYCSYNTGWGITIYDSDYCTVQYNTADYCTRLYNGWSGADAASLLMVYNSDHNYIYHNSFVGGGDGVFLAGATHSLQKRPCNYNDFWDNDCSDSPNNGFEGTFSGYNIFRENISSGSNYGYWLGYAYNNEIRDNVANNCATAGIAIEHGRNHIIEGNTFNNNSRGIYLWTDEDASLVSAYPEARDSYHYTIEGNTISGNSYGIICEAIQTPNPTRYSYDYTIINNTITNNTRGIRFLRTTDSTIHSNIIENNIIRGFELEYSSSNTIYNNKFTNTSNVSDNSTNIWNIAKTAGTNILGNPYLGGNYWSDYYGVDINADGLGDTQVPHKSGGGIINGGDNLPLLPVHDTDGDGLADEWEIENFGNLDQGPNDDPDMDLLINMDEYIWSCDPDNPDTDNDGLLDGEEVHTYGTHPVNPDTDNDGLNDGDELTLGTDPLDWDTDDDGMADGWEVAKGLNPFFNDASGDLDGDGLNNLAEFQYGTDPDNPDTDSDGFTDKEEIDGNSNPLDPYSFPTGWVTLASDPCYFPYTDVVTPPSPDYWPRSDISVMAGNGKIYSGVGYGPRTYTDSDGSSYYENRQSGLSIYTISSNTWVSSRWNNTGPRGYNNGNGTAGPTENQGTYTGNNQAFGYDRDNDGTLEFFVLAGYPIWDGYFGIYDPDTNSWSKSADRPFHSGGGYRATYLGTALVYNNKAYTYGGRYGGPFPNSFFSYDIMANTWTELPDGPVKMWQHCGEVVGNTMYLMGGNQDDIDYSTRVIKYNFSTSTWDTTSCAPMPVGVNRPASVVFEGKIYVTGGTDSTGSACKNIQVYDPVSNTWTQIFNLPEPRTKHGAVVVGTTLYIIGGEGPSPSGGVEKKSDLFAVDFTTIDRPRVRVDTPSGTISGNINIAYKIYDINSSICSIDVKYSVNGGSTWSNAAMGSGGDGTSGLSSSATGIPHTFVWNSVADLGYDDWNNVKIKITPVDTAVGTAGETAVFTITNTIADIDNDQLPDLYEIDKFGDLSQSGSDDYDGDGKTNYEELIAGTDPTDDTSFFALTNIEEAGEPVVVTLTWNSVTGKYYAVYYSDDDFGAEMTWALAQDNIPASGTGTNTWNDDGTHTNPAPSAVMQRFYKIKVQTN